MTESGHPHTIESELEREDDYQAPPREGESPMGARPDPGVDVNVVESQQRPGLQTSETVVTDPEHPTFTISGKDEEADQDDPRATPPGETM